MCALNRLTPKVSLFWRLKTTNSLVSLKFYFKSLSAFLNDRSSESNPVSGFFKTISSGTILKITFFLLLVLGGSTICPGQKNKKQLEREKKENLRKMQQTNQILNEVKQEKKASLTQLKVLRQQARLKERTIQSIQEEVGMLQGDILHLQSEEERLAYTLVRIRKEYASMVYAASKASVSNQLLFLFASETFNQFFKRIQYLRFYSEARRDQAAKIREISKIFKIMVSSTRYCI